MLLKVKPGDKLRLKKAHPCGSYEWEVVRAGADIGIKCLKCHRKAVLTRSGAASKVEVVQGSKSEIQS
ncbi:MAG: DUF951 domain-containing protein [Chloroflexi bacterium]|nr:DUF951 domain-containing protein [Chloroflexota bacterium]